MASDSDNSSSQVKIVTVDVEKNYYKKDYEIFKGTEINSCPNNNINNKNMQKSVVNLNLVKIRDS